MQPSIVYVLYFSPTGTSKKVADAVAQAIACPAVNAPDRNAAEPTAAIPVRTIDLTHSPAPAVTLPHDAVAVFAMPVYGGHVPPTASERMRGLCGEGTPAVIIAVYGNRAFEGAAAQLAAATVEQGFVPAAAAAFVGEHSYSTPATPIAAGRPDSQDLADAAAFGAAVRRKLTAGETPAPVDVRHLKGPRTPLLPLLRFIGFVLGYQRRQKKHPVVYLPRCDADRCTHCGRCAAICPTQAIARGDEEHTDPARCIRCCACVKGCPVGARSFSTPFSAVLARDFARRKPPVTLL